MHIIAGSLRRRRLHVPKGLVTRPTTARVRDAVFGMLESRSALLGASVLDLFAGTGSLGLEAISRGAAAAYFVECRADVLRAARKNAAALGVADRCRFRCADVGTFLLKCRDAPYDMIFADPPYDLAGLATLPDRALERLAPGGWLALEHDRRVSFASHERLATARPFGRTVASLFFLPDQTPPQDGT